MRHYACPIAAAATGWGLAVMVLGTTTFSAPQSAGPRALGAKTPITYFIAVGAPQSGFRPSDRRLALWALEAWQRSAAGKLRFEPAIEQEALVRLYWAEPNSGQYGEMRPLMVGGRRGAAVFVRPDVTSLDEAVADRAVVDELLRDSIVYLTCLHELGHALGLVHTSDFRDIMYSFGYGGDLATYFGRYRGQLHDSSDIATVSGLSDGDVSRLRATYATQ